MFGGGGKEITRQPAEEPDEAGLCGVPGALRARGVLLALVFEVAQLDVSGCEADDPNASAPGRAAGGGVGGRACDVLAVLDAAERHVDNGRSAMWGAATELPKAELHVGCG